MMINTFFKEKKKNLFKKKPKNHTSTLFVSLMQPLGRFFEPLF